MSSTDLVQNLASALDITGSLVGEVRDAQWGDPTPCTEWKVRDLVRHVVNGNFIFAHAITGEPSAGPRIASDANGELARDYRDSATALVAAFRQPGALEKVITVPFGSVPGTVAVNLRITDVLVHGWDLARATGQAASFPEDLVEPELEFSRPWIEKVPPGRAPFAPPQSVSDEAPAIDRLAALLGRPAEKRL